jgi:iron complex transport system substrate-binding protein
MRHRLLSLVVLLTLALVSVVPLTAQEAPEGFPLTIVDGEGVEHTFEQPIERIACIDNACVETMAFLGVMPIAVGEFYNYNILVDEANFGAAAADVPQIPSDDSGNPDFEAIAELAPQLVVGWSDLREPLQGIAPVYAMHYQGDSIDAFPTDVRLLGRVLGLSEAAIEEKIDAAIDRLEAYSLLSPKDKSLYITGIADENGAFYNYDTTRFAPCGLISYVAQCGYAPGVEGDLSVEAVLSIDPDVIVIEEYDPVNNEAARIIDGIAANQPLWQELSAYQNETIFVLPRTRARMTTIQSMVTVLDTVVPLIYPDIFPTALTDEQVQAILADESGTSDAQFPVTITDGSGAQYTFDAPVERIVCLSAGCQDNLFTLGLTPMAIASPMVTVHELLYGAAPSEAVTLINLSGISEPDIEQIAGLQPDVVIGSIGLHDGVRVALESTGETPVLLEYPRTPDETFASLRMTAAITETTDEAEVTIQLFEDRMNAYGALAAGDASVALVFGQGSPEATFVEAADAQNCLTFSTYRLATCPFELPENAGMFASFGYGQFSFEGMLELNPDVLLFAGYDNLGVTDPAILEAFNANPLWNALDAVQNERVYSVDSWVFSGQGGLTLLRRAVDTAMPVIYPDIFPAPLTDEQVQEILAAQ